MEIHASSKNYEVKAYQSFSFMDAVLGIPDAFFVIDRKVYDIYHSRLFSSIKRDQLMLIDAAEANKTVETALAICDRMCERQARRSTVLVSVGGGMIQDVTGFAANILYRGIRWQFVPTTLLAACDSCIGGKTSLNYKKYKNLLGTFYPPDMIHICPLFFETLSGQDYLSGLGEVIKFHILDGMSGIARIEHSLLELLDRKAEKVEECLIYSLNLKKQYIEEDEFDRGKRVCLNFAHTFGHAFETASSYKIPHGMAVAMGTVAADHISFCRGWLDAETVKKVEHMMMQVINVDSACLPKDFKVILEAVRKDKKQLDTYLTAVLLRDDHGRICIEVVHDLQTDEITEAVTYLLDLLEDENA